MSMGYEAVTQSKDIDQSQIIYTFGTHYIMTDIFGVRFFSFNCSMNVWPLTVLLTVLHPNFIFKNLN